MLIKTFFILWKSVFGLFLDIGEQSIHYLAYAVFLTEICRQNKLIQEKKDNLLKLIAEVKGKKQQVEVLTANIQDLKEEYARKKESKFPVVHVFKTLI